MKFEINSQQHTHLDEDKLTSRDFVQINMIRDGVAFNSALAIECFKDGGTALDVLKTTIEVLVKRLYPEYWSPVAIARREILECEQKIASLRKFLERAETAANVNSKV